MNSRPTQPLKSILQPYVFVLKEGKTIKKDFLDYSLMILFTHSSERIQSPQIEEHADLDNCIEIRNQLPQPRAPERTKRT